MNDFIIDISGVAACQGSLPNNLIYTFQPTNDIKNALAIVSKGTVYGYITDMSAVLIKTLLERNEIIYAKAYGESKAIVYIMRKRI